MRNRTYIGAAALLAVIATLAAIAGTAPHRAGARQATGMGRPA
jgi:hypothetical protein